MTNFVEVNGLDIRLTGKRTVCVVNDLSLSRCILPNRPKLWSRRNSF